MLRTQTTTEEKNRITRKNRKFVPYIIAVVCITAFYSFEFLENFSDEYTNALNNHAQKKKERTKALGKVKEYAKGSLVYEEYLKAKSEADIAWKEFKNIQKGEEVFGFKSLQLFLAEFGPMFCFFCYALFNLFRSFYFERKNVGMKVLHGLIISGTMFYFFWMFQQFQDFSKVTYYLMTFISAGVVVLAVYLITRYRNHYINTLKKNMLDLAKFTFLNTRSEKKGEMLNLMEKIVKEKKGDIKNRKYVTAK